MSPDQSPEPDSLPGPTESTVATTTTAKPAVAAAVRVPIDDSGAAEAETDSRAGAEPGAEFATGAALAEPRPARPRRSRGRRLLRLAGRLILIGAVGSIALTGIYRVVPPLVTPLMLIRLVSGQGLHKDWVSYEEISPNVARAVIASEDSGFCSHNGFDWTALDQAWSRNQTHKRIRGGSTISNQTAKNVFLWPDRTYLRKGVEFYFTVLIEALWGKKRILEMYLNEIEWGPGIYGAETAARVYFKKPAQALTRHEAALLAAVLPNPLHWSPAKPSAYIRGRAGTIEARMADIADPTGDPCKQ